jgi:hypothetical protein
MPELHKPALFAYTFCAIDGGPLPALATAWQAVVRLGMTEPVEGLHASPKLGPAPTRPVPRFELLAAGDRPDEGQFQAYAFASHDVAGVVGCLAPGEGDAATWEELIGVWERALGEHAEPLGSALALVGLNDEGAAEEPPPVGDRGWESGLRTAAGFSVWQARGEARLLALTGPERAEAEIDRFAWWAGETRLPPLARYLLHASKLRFEHRVYERQIGEFHQANRDLDADIVELTSVLAEDSRRPLTAEQLDDAAAHLVRAETKLVATTGSMTELADLRRTVKIARENMRPLVPAPAQGASVEDSPFAADLELADWLDAQARHDIGYAKSTRERADRVRDLLKLRFDHASSQREQDQNYLLLLQTALLSALIAGATAFSVLRKDSPVPEQVHVPLIALAVTLALALPLVAVHWRARFRWFDRLAAGLLLASLGWYVTASVWVATTSPNEDAPWWVVVPVMLVCGGAGIWLTYVQDRSLGLSRGERASSVR